MIDVTYDIYIWENKNISFKIRNHLPTVLSNQIYHTNRVMAVKLPLGKYWWTKQVKKTEIKKRAILATLPTILAGFNMLGKLTIKAANSWLGYKSQK